MNLLRQTNEACYEEMKSTIALRHIKYLFLGIGLARIVQSFKLMPRPGRGHYTGLLPYFGTPAVHLPRRFAHEMDLISILPSQGEPLQHSPHPGASVSLIGAGPGDPDLLTVKALRELRKADLIIADRLVSDEILNMITLSKGSTKLRVAKKYPGCQENAQEEIYSWMREALAAGKYVLRLKIGDPFMFGRGGEEVMEIRKWGYEPLVVPGISSAICAPLLAGIPVTHRGIANQVVVGTGYGMKSMIPPMRLFDENQTAIFLMAVSRLRNLCKQMTDAGYPTELPVAVVERASTPSQRLLIGSVADIADIADEHNVCAPAVIVVGGAVKVLHGDVRGVVQDEKINSKNPLYNEKIFQNPPPVGEWWTSQQELNRIFDQVGQVNNYC